MHVLLGCLDKNLLFLSRIILVPISALRASCRPYIRMRHNTVYSHLLKYPNQTQQDTNHSMDKGLHEARSAETGTRIILPILLDFLNRI